MNSATPSDGLKMHFRHSPVGEVVNLLMASVQHLKLPTDSEF